MLRPFLDANILFSAAYLERSGMKGLWKLSDVELVTSHYAVEEAGRNLPLKSQKADLQDLLNRVDIVCIPAEETLFRDPHGLPEKDQPILWAAMDSQCSHLITGDKHFGELFDTEIEGVVVIQARDFISLHKSLSIKIE